MGQTGKAPIWGRSRRRGSGGLTRDSSVRLRRSSSQPALRTSPSSLPARRPTSITSLADIEWMILPPVTNGQFYVAEAMDAETGFQAPIAVATWAFVSEEIDRRLSAEFDASRPLATRRMDEWRDCLDHRSRRQPARHNRRAAVAQSGPLKDKDAKLLAPGGAGRCGRYPRHALRR